MKARGVYSRQNNKKNVIADERRKDAKGLKDCGHGNERVYKRLDIKPSGFVFFSSSVNGRPRHLYDIICMQRTKKKKKRLSVQWLFVQNNDKGGGEKLYMIHGRGGRSRV